MGKRVGRTPWDGGEGAVAVPRAVAVPHSRRKRGTRPEEGSRMRLQVDPPMTVRVVRVRERDAQALCDCGEWGELWWPWYDLRPLSARERERW